MSDPKVGRCISCGLLGARSLNSGNPTTLPLTLEVNSELRQTGKFLYFGGYGKCAPYCVAHAAKLRTEFEAAGGETREQPDREQLALQIIDTDRDCPEWHPYTAGSPKEHLDEKRQQRMQEAFIAFQERMERDRRTWEMGMESASEARQARATRVERRLAWAAILLAVIQAIGLTADSIVLKIFYRLFVGK